MLRARAVVRRRARVVRDGLTFLVGFGFPLERGSVYKTRVMNRQMELHWTLDEWFDGIRRRGRRITGTTTR